jgi:hypothetical protein
VDELLRTDKVTSHLPSAYRHNSKKDLSDHANPQRLGYSIGREAGLLNCAWPEGGNPTSPFVHSNEVWTGMEYEAALNLMMSNLIGEGLAIVRASRDRYDGTVRNPFNENQCGHWYARAMASYALLQGLTGVRYDAVRRTLIIAPGAAGDFRSFFCWATGYGTADVPNGAPSLDVKRGASTSSKSISLP